MKATELRIGNWVNFETPYQIKSYLDVSQSYVKFYSPIPLTEELLIKCGFSCTHSGQGDGQTWAKRIVEIHGDFTPLYPLSVKNGAWSLAAPINYLHQLQNLYFSITGEELQIQL